MSKKRQKEISYVEASDIKANCNILQVAYDWGVDVYPRGRRYGIYCPNPDHHDRNLGNCFLYEDKNFFHCFACGASGGPIDLVMMLDRIDFKEAVNKLGRRYGLVSTKTIDLDNTWFGLSNSEYEELGLSGVTIKIPYDIDECERTLYRHERYSMMDLAKEDPVMHDELLINKFCEKIYDVAGFLALVDNGDFLKYGEVFKDSASWRDPAGEVVIRYKRLLEKGLINKELLDTIFTASTGDNLMEKAKKHAKEILQKKKKLKEKNKAVSM
jgi:hypothetical protein